MGRLIVTLHLIHGGLDGEEAVGVNRAVLAHFGKRHMDGVVVGSGGGKGTFGRSICRGGGILLDSEMAYGEREDSEGRLPMGFFPSVRATVSGATNRASSKLAGDPKRLVYCTTSN